MIQQAIGKIVTGVNLTEREMTEVMETIMTGNATQSQIGAFLVALRMKGETVEEITGAAKVMRAKVARVQVDAGDLLVDTCGTGGDASGTFNVSTTAAFVVAGAGLPVAKHGNRSISSHCGSADVLEALGVDLSLSPEQVAECIRTAGIGFMFAPAFHPAMKHAIVPRRELAIRTIFNVLGPLTNPAGANVQVMGVYAAELTEIIAAVLGRLGSRRALVVCGEGNMDEITVTGSTKISEYYEGRVITTTVTPEDLGLVRATLDDIRGEKTAAGSAGQVRGILAGEAGARLDMVLANAGAALYAAGAATSIASGVKKARQVIASGAALEKLAALVACCRANKE